MLSNLNKIFEKIIFKRLHCFLEKYNCIYELQYGFRAKHSTIHVLHKRKQSLIINGYESEIQILNHGVSQGSVLGPLLFLIYINDLHLSIQNSKVYHFADDTNLLKISTSCKKLQNELNNDLINVYHWLLANEISLNEN